jgi:phospholipid/cholesterol/gamma-HCH transport system substrate-binding protein
MNKDRRLEVKVGLFVIGTVALTLIGVVLLGRSRHVFEPRVKLHVTFSDVAGLVSGAPVRVSGVNMGTVSQIEFVRAEPRPQIRVDLDIKRSAVELVRQDSVARISSQGLLGDKIIDVTAGSTSAPPVGDGGEIRSAEAPDLDRMLRQASHILDDVKHVGDRLALAADEIASPKTIAEVRESVTHIHALLHATEKGQGLAHAIFYDKRTADDLARVAANVQSLTAHVDRGVQHLDAVLATTDAEGRQLINNVSRAAKTVGRTAEEIERSRVVQNLSKASSDLALMTDYMKSGRGTLGALVVDPTVYEQLVQVLGGVGRSRILRALVRYAISRDEEKRVGRVVDEKNVPRIEPEKAKSSAKR